MACYENIVFSVGSTPLIKLNRVTAGLPATIALKGEFNNPLGSVYPPLSILAEAPVSVVDKVVDRRGTRKLATAYLEYLWSDEGQKLAVQSYFRPRSDKLLAKNAALFPRIKPVSVDDVFGGWDAAQKVHFADGGYFDQIYRAK
jgi:ABC-type sulfate transport system substrate-binding protein